MCPLRLASAGIWPRRWSQAENLVIGLCIGTNVRIQSTKPYTIASKTGTGIVTTVKNVKTETTNGKTIPARAPLGSGEKRSQQNELFSYNY